MPGAGASSSTFWWRRCSEQSRLPSHTALPWLSASTWISTWRGWPQEFLDVDLGVAEGAARFLAGQRERVEQGGLFARTTRMPRPPPPPAALTITG